MQPGGLAKRVGVVAAGRTSGNRIVELTQQIARRYVRWRDNPSNNNVLIALHVILVIGLL
jgi:hypothetical protein